MKNIFQSRISEGASRRESRWESLALVLAMGIVTFFSSSTSARAQTQAGQTAVKISASAFHSLVVKQDGTVWGWGLNGSGQLGDGTTPPPLFPVKVQGLSGVTVTAVATGRFHSLALDSQGKVWAWGDNSQGQLGDGSYRRQTTAVKVPGLTGVIAITAGDYTSYALTSTGEVWAWGANNFGALGRGVMGYQQNLFLVSKPAGVTFKAISAGSYHCLALKSDGGVMAWGYNGLGQLGDGTQIDRSAPVTVSGLSGIQTIGAGRWNSSAVKVLDGSVMTWGGLTYTPVAVSGLTGVASISSGCAHSLALKSDHTVMAWGSNSLGQLGDGTKIDRTLPVAVNGLTGVDSISGGNFHTIALKQDGTVVTWGSNDKGQLGDGRSDYLIKSPVPVVNQSHVVSIATGPCSDAAFLVKDDGSSWMSGVDATNGLFTAVDSLNNHTQFSGGSRFNLALGVSGNKNGVSAWGENGYGQLGTGDGLSQTTPKTVPGISTATGVSAGVEHGLALLSNGTVQAWGDNSIGQLGTGDGISRTTPVSVPGLSGIRKVTSGSWQNLSLDQTGNVRQWGGIVSGLDENDSGYYTDLGAYPTPVQILTGVSDISAGWAHQLAVKTNGDVWAWGDNILWQCGEIGEYAQLSPIRVPGISNVSTVSAGNMHSLALKTDKTIWAWGDNSYGQLGDGTGMTRTIPTSIPLTEGVVGIGAGSLHSIALREDGTVLVWGDCTTNSLGLGLSGTYRAAPAPLLGLNLNQTGVPTVAISSPTTVVLGQTLTIQSIVADTAGTVTKVEYYSEGIKVGESTAQPFSFIWTPTTWGNFNITAIATDNKGTSSVRSNKLTVNVPYDNDGNKLPDWWEIKYFGAVGQNPASLSPSGSGLTLLQSYQQGKNPVDIYNGVAPNLAITGGNGQGGTPGGFLAQGLSIRVTDKNGLAIANAPVTFTVSSGGGGLSSTNSGSTQTTISTRADGSGNAQVYLQFSSTANGVNNITVTAGSAAPVVFAEYTDDALVTVSYTYDSEGQVKTSVDPNQNVYQYEYDQDGSPTIMRYPDSTFEQINYDAAGNPATFKTRSGKTKTMVYDNRDRNTGTSWDDGVTPSVTATFDDANRLQSTGNTNSTISYAYNDANETLSETQTVAGLGGKTLRYTYNTDGELETLTYPDNTVVGYLYNNRQEVTDILSGGTSGTSIVHYDYDSNGNRIAKNLGNGVNSLLAYDATQRLTSIADTTPAPTQGTLLQRFDYGYDPMNRISYIKRDNNLGDVYGYDPHGQLTSVQYSATNPETATPVNPLRTVNYLFDAAGNREQVTDSTGGTTSYTANSNNQYTSVNGSLLANDNRGNLIFYAGETYTYDAENSLIQAAGGATATLAYDPSGRCVKRVENGVTTYFVYDGWNVIAEYNSGGTQTARYVQGTGADEILTKTDSLGVTIYYHTDHLGSVTKLTSTTGAVLEQYTYDIYGTATIRDGTGNSRSVTAYGNRFLFTGREYLASLNLYDYRNRVYSSALGRFLQADPIGHEGDGFNLNRYCGNNPVNYTDPEGTQVVISAPLNGNIPWDIRIGIDALKAQQQTARNTQNIQNSLYGSRQYNPPNVSLSGVNRGGNSGGNNSSIASRISQVAGIASVVPILNVPASIIGAGAELYQGNYVSAGVAMLGVIPFVADFTEGFRAIKAVRGVVAVERELVVVKEAGSLAKIGRAGKQARLRELVSDTKVSSADRGWIQQEINSIKRGKRINIRVPNGKNLAHRRGFEAKKGFGYEYSDLQDIDLHKLQHGFEGY